MIYIEKRYRSSTYSNRKKPASILLNCTFNRRKTRKEKKRNKKQYKPNTRTHIGSCVTNSFRHTNGTNTNYTN